jgi:hypothetical protein
MQHGERPWRRGTFSSQIQNREQTAQQNCDPKYDERRNQHDFLSRHDYFADRPERYSSKLQMCPRERNADDGDSEEHCGYEMT